mmetsp:Transcript_60351/g.130834  ORF Transcript_60351/g.130834 Transcript_60351/m.130834 type:complete len:206 (-) Transcript_60351:7-624(-)
MYTLETLGRLERSWFSSTKLPLRLTSRRNEFEATGVTGALCASWRLRKRRLTGSQKTAENTRRPPRTRSRRARWASPKYLLMGRMIPTLLPGRLVFLSDCPTKEEARRRFGRNCRRWRRRHAAPAFFVQRIMEICGSGRREVSLGNCSISGASVLRAFLLVGRHDAPDVNDHSRRTHRRMQNNFGKNGIRSPREGIVAAGHKGLL